jgi:hypothetical protein
MKNKFLAIIMACVLACGVFAIAGCGGNSSSGSSAAPSGPTDEELITADVDGIFGKIFTPDVIKELVAEGAGDSLGQMESLGITIDYDALAEAFKNVIKIKVDSVEVNGDTAVANVTITYPNYNDPAANEVMEKVMTEKLSGIDATKLQNDPDSVSAALNEAIVAGLTSTDIPTASEASTIDYVKSGDTWTMKDADKIEDLLKSYGV